MTATKDAAVLVVDDDKAVCDIISAELGSRGYATAVAFNGREALAYLRSSPRPPQLILLDLMMPEMNGWEFRRVQEDDPALACIPVAIITGLPDVKDKAWAIGAVDVLFKPSRVEELDAVVSRFCS